MAQESASLMHVVGKIVAGIIIFMVVAAVALLLSAEALLNGVVKERITSAANNQKGTSLTLGTFRYNLLSNRISCDSLRLTVQADNDGDDSIRLAGDSFSCADINWVRVVFGNGFSCGDIVVDGIRGHIASPGPDRTSQGRGSREKQNGPDVPDRLVPLSVGLVSVRGGAFSRTTHSHQGVSHDSVARFTAEIRNLNLESSSADRSGLAFAFGHMEFLAERAAFQLPDSKYRIAFASARVSDADSSILIDSLKVAPAIPDQEYFAASPLRSTRFRASIGRLAAYGLDFAGLVKGRQYTAHIIEVHRPVVNITVDMRKKPTPDPAKMPNEILTGIQENFRIDSMLVNGGTIEYAELYPYSSTPAVLRWTGVRLAAVGISNGQAGADSSPARIEASAMFQDTARMIVSMLLPLAQQDFSLTCHGALHSLPLPSLNSFLEVAERTRVISGRADSIRFAFSVANGHSRGTVRPVYHDLKIEVLAKQTGRSDGIAQRLGSLIANMFKIRKNNFPGGPGGAKEGPIQYARTPGDPFFKLVWFSLRGGLGNVVGF